MAKLHDELREPIFCVSNSLPLRSVNLIPRPIWALNVDLQSYAGCASKFLQLAHSAPKRHLGNHPVPCCIEGPERGGFDQGWLWKRPSNLTSRRCAPKHQRVTIQCACTRDQFCLPCVIALSCGNVSVVFK